MPVGLSERRSALEGRAGANAGSARTAPRLPSSPARGGPRKTVPLCRPQHRLAPEPRHSPLFTARPWGAGRGHSSARLPAPGRLLAEPHLGRRGQRHKSKGNFAARNLNRGTVHAPPPAQEQRLPVPVPAPPSLSRPPASTHTAPGSPPCRPAGAGTRPGRGCQEGQGRSSRLEFSSPRAERPGGCLGLSPSPFQPPGRGAKPLQVGTAGPAVIRPCSGLRRPQAKPFCSGIKASAPCARRRARRDLPRVCAMKLPRSSIPLRIP